jgi:ribosomal protein L32
MGIGEREIIAVVVGLLICGAVIVTIVVAAILLSRRKRGEETPASPDTILCPNCGEKNPMDNRFCEYCGSSLEEGSA